MAMPEVEIEYSESASSAKEFLPVCVIGCEKVTCSTCGKNPTLSTPLVSAIYICRYGKFWPWAKYRVIKNDLKVAYSRVSGMELG